MNIIVLGARGYVGSNLAARLERDGHVVDRVARIQGYRLAAFPLEEADAVFNCAAQLVNTFQMYEDNVVLVHNYLEAISLKGIRFIQLGSTAETGPIEGPRFEDSFCDPSNLYEATKLAATNLCLGYAREHGLDVCVARLFTIYGGQNDKPRMMLPTLWNAWKDNKTFTCHPGGHDWTYMDDLVEGLVTLLHAPHDVIKGQIFNFGTGISTPNSRIVELFNRAVGGAGVAVIHKEIKYHSYDVSDWRADTSKTEDLLGWRAHTPVEEGIRRFVMDQWFSIENGAPGL